MNDLPFVLTLAGFDGSAGAGILADVKAFCDFGVYGQAVCTALTVQNESSFVSPGFLAWDRIQMQLETLYEKRSFRWVKIGLIENAAVLKKTIEWLRGKTPDVFIVWDPIVKASAGFRFFPGSEIDSLLSVVNQVDLMTPNRFEFNYLGLGAADSQEKIALGKSVSVLLKGGHAGGEEATDILWHEGKRYKFTSKRLPGNGKHGSGCTLSAAILANLALGKTLPEACAEAKKYIEKFLSGGTGNLGGVFER